jgi:hypothetical protein
VSHSELAELYGSNGRLTSNEEDELACALPDKEAIMSESDFCCLVERYNKNVKVLDDIKNKKQES